jgi:hypothetical protein
VSEGLKPEEVAVLFPSLKGRVLRVDEVRELMKVKLGESDLSADFKSYEKGEFFFTAVRTADGPQTDGFFLVAVPRNQKIKLVVSASGFRQLTLDKSSGNGLFADAGEIKMFPPLGAPATPAPSVPPTAPWRLPYSSLPRR